MIAIEALYQIYLSHPTIVTDSRMIVPGCLFFALKGPRFNGNEYAQQAIEEGAAYAVIDEAEYGLDERYLLVDHVLPALQQLALHHRRQFEIPVIAITGSNGKTTTKELLSAVLSSEYHTHFTKGNFNNHIGVPLTLLAMPANTEVAIIEMGANHLKEIDFLCTLAEPTHGIITNIGKAHLEGFGSLEGVKQAKSELYRFLAANNGVVFINEDEAFLQQLAADNPIKVFYKSSDAIDAEVLAFETHLVNARPYIKATFRHSHVPYEVQTSLTGAYNFNNVMTAISVGRYFKVPPVKIKKALEAYVPANNRSQLLEQGSNTFLMDAYNANPDSMQRALENFAQAKGDYKIAIIGDMLELGTYSQAEHTDTLSYALNQSGIHQVITVGTEFGKVTVSSDRHLHFEDVVALKKWFDGQAFKNAFILLKGSRGIRLEQLLDAEV